MGRISDNPSSFIPGLSHVNDLLISSPWPSDRKFVTCGTVPVEEIPVPTVRFSYFGVGVQFVLKVHI